MEWSITPGPELCTCGGVTADTLKRKKLMGMVYGWAETDSAAAFLPEEFQE